MACIEKKFKMPCMQAIKNILNKTTFNFDRTDVDLYNFHPQLQIILAMNGLFFKEKNSILRFVWPGLIMCNSIIWLVFEIIFIMHFLNIKDYSHATECFCYLVILGCVPVVLVSLFLNKEKLYTVVERMNDDFLVIRNLGPRYRKPFLDGQLEIWKLCWGWYTFESCVAGLYALAQIVTLCYYSLFATHDETTYRPLQFLMWLPQDDPYRTPNFEIFLVMEFFVMVSVANTFAVFVYSLFHILLHYYIIMDMIILDFQVLFEGLEESVALLSRYDERRMEAQHILNKRVGNIVNMHLSVFAAVKTVSSVYGPPLCYQVMCTSIAICMIAYQMAEKLEYGTFDVLFLSLGAAACLQLWIPCYLGTKIRDKAFEVGDASWECGWHLTTLGLLVRNDILIIVSKAQQPITIKFTGLPDVNLETFSSLMSKSYSYFNMVRQYSQ